MCLLQNGETDCCEGKHDDNDGISRIRNKNPLTETASTSAEGTNSQNIFLGTIFSCHNK